ncbi:MAG: DUF2975 domain-containing protein [Alphaproteobacteria bacterium]|nr:DUF2975 domain-containing protein [Alphaproteobacteria bacterium]
MSNAVLADRARAAAGGAQTMALLALWLIGVTLAINYGVSTFRLVANSEIGSLLDVLRAVGPHLITLLPAAFYLSALLHLRRALSAFEAGQFFSTPSAHAVRRAGEDATLGLLAQIAFVPTLIVWVRREAPIAIDFELVDLALLAFLAFIAVAGRVLDIAVAVKVENDQII